jgi:ABC-type polysaccharide/polyol phosphate transport system ATPase subunit
MDTPVKRYSSGMYVRLAFAVAAHRSAERSRRSLEPEILLVDEVLAARGWCCKNDTSERRRTYGRFKRKNRGETRILTRV